MQPVPGGMFPAALADLAAKQQPDATRRFLSEVGKKMGVLKACKASFSDTWMPDTDASGSLLAITASITGKCVINAQKAYRYACMDRLCIQNYVACIARTNMCA